MCDISDVEESLKALLAQIAYPNGTANSSAVLDAEGKAHSVQIYRGWPVPSQLDTDMAAGTVDVSIFPTAVEQNVTRYGLQFEVLPLPKATLTLTLGGSGNIELENGGGLLREDLSGYLVREGNATSVTVGGTVKTPQNVALIVNGFGYSYAVRQGDSLTSIATALAIMISENTPCISSGPVISIPTAHSIIPRVGVVGQAIQEVARQKRNVMISIWCPSPDLRDNAAKLFDPVLKSTEFLNMTDGTKCRLIYVNSPITDTIQKEACYRRDLIYSCEYGTTITTEAPTVTIEKININRRFGPSLESVLIETIYM